MIFHFTEEEHRILSLHPMPQRTKKNYFSITTTEPKETTERETGRYESTRIAPRKTKHWSRKKLLLFDENQAFTPTASRSFIFCTSIKVEQIPFSWVNRTIFAEKGRIFIYHCALVTPYTQRFFYTHKKSHYRVENWSPILARFTPATRKLNNQTFHGSPLKYTSEWEDANRTKWKETTEATTNRRIY